MSNKSSVALAAATLGLSVEQVIERVQAMRDGAVINLMMAETMSKPQVLFLLNEAGGKAFVNLEDLSRPYGADKASLVGNLGEAMTTMLDSGCPIDLILYAKVGNAVEVLNEEIAWLDHMLSEHRASEAPVAAAA